MQTTTFHVFINILANKKKFFGENLLEGKLKSVGKEVAKNEKEEITEKMFSILGLPEVYNH